MTSMGRAARGVGGSPPIGRDRPTPPLAALIFAPASVLGYMSGNLNQTTLAAALPTLAGSVGFALAVWAAVALLRRRADASSAVIACLWVVASVYYLSLFGPLNTWLGGDYTLRETLPWTLAALALATFGLSRAPQACAPLHVVLSVIALVMLATPAWRVAGFAWRNAAAASVYDPAAAEAELARMQGPETPEGDTRPPDIYHFVFDRFASAEVLSRHYGIETPVNGFLEARGFHVAPDSRSNYLKTGHSLASTLYMDYLDLLAEEPRLDGADWRPIFAMLDDYRTARFLRGRGYEALQFGSWWTGTHRSSIADANAPFGFDEFPMYYLRRTALRAVAHALPANRLAALLDWDNGQCQRVARQVEAIKAIGAREQPVYVFAHFLVPHDPYVFAADGRCLGHDEAIARGRRAGYAEQVGYAGRIIEDLVGALLAEGRPAPVIIIQADEGPFPDRNYTVPWQEASLEELDIKTGILNAVYLPGGDYGRLRPDITPVNLYRAVFDSVLGTSFGQLPDRVFVFPDDFNLYDFIDVTDRLNGAADPADAAGAAAGGRLR